MENFFKELLRFKKRINQREQDLSRVIKSNPLPNYKSGWPQPPDVAIIHYTAGYTAQGCYNALLKRGLSVHECVERDGVIHKFVDHKNRAIHAGYGQWGGQGNMNSRSFGVEVVNFGWGYPGDGSPSSWGSFGPDKDELSDTKEFWHRLETYESGGKIRKTRILTQQKMSYFTDHRSEHKKKMWAEYTTEQIDSTHWVVWSWIKNNPAIILENVVGHEHVSPHRKQDPGPAWPWKETEKYLEGMARKERPELLDPNYRSKERIKAVQSHVHRCGPEIGIIDGIWGPKTISGIRTVIERYGDIYNLELDFKDIEPENSLTICNAFRRIPGFDPGNR